MKGSILKRSGGFTIVYDIGMVWDEKKQAYVRKQKWEKVPWKKRESQVTDDVKWVPPNKTDAEKYLAERLSQLNKSEFVEPSSITFREFKDTWLKNYARGEVSPLTMDQYTSLYKKHIIPYLGGKKLSQIGIEDIQGFKSALQQKGLGEQMVKHNHDRARDFHTFHVTRKWLDKSGLNKPVGGDRGNGEETGRRR